ncbi:hypothetical protein HDU88_006914 [Geranomyces variabilis]|nr:hypothetical protein HDU88_006914 [Geranomyces variabilis]
MAVSPQAPPATVRADEDLMARYGTTYMYDSFVRPYPPGRDPDPSYQPYLTDLAGAPRAKAGHGLRDVLYAPPPPPSLPPLQPVPREVLRAAVNLESGRAAEFDFSLLGPLARPRTLNTSHSSSLLQQAHGSGRPPPVPQKRISLKLNLGAPPPSAPPPYADYKKHKKKRSEDQSDAERRAGKKKRSLSSQGSDARSPADASSDIDILN